MGLSLLLTQQQTDDFGPSTQKITMGWLYRQIEGKTTNYESSSLLLQSFLSEGLATSCFKAILSVSWRITHLVTAMMGYHIYTSMRRITYSQRGKK
jgi:hypothetical protein